MTGLNPFDWYGGAFLALYAVLYFGAMIAGFAIANWLRPDGNFAVLDDEEDLAVLAGNKDRLAETLVARMLARGALQIDKSKKLYRATGASGQNASENAILALETPLRWSQVRKIANHRAEEIDTKLVNRGVLMEKGEALKIGLFAAIPYLLLIAFGYTKLDIGLERDRPVGFLVVFLIITAVSALVRWVTTDRQTREGQRAWKDARSRAARLRQAPTGAETGMAVALFGTGVIATSSFGDFHRMRASSGDGGSGCGSDGGSGCGGGGCGGCGG